MHVVSERRFLVGHHYLQTGTVGHQVGQMDGIAMAIARRAKQLSVGAYRCTARTDIIQSVAVHVANRNAVYALPIARLSCA